MVIIDISLPIHPKMPYLPGTLPTDFEEFKSASGQSRLTKVSMHSHTGTHVDAPSHIVDTVNGRGVDAFDDSVFYGTCRVLDVRSTVHEITRSDIQAHVVKPNERILFMTSNSERGFDINHDEWVGLSAEGAEYLGEIGVTLVGIDWFGIKPPRAKDNTAHSALLVKGIPIIEGLNLAGVKSGAYLLSAFPINYSNLDGAQVAARLIVE